VQDEVITSLDQVTAAWLTAALWRSGALTRGSVTGFEQEAGQRVLSTNARLRVRYSDDALGDRPARLFLKMVNADQEVEFFGPSEVNYYARDYVGVADAPLVRCHHAVYSAEKQRYHLLLDDVSETHVERARKPPTLEHGLALAEGLAAMHAHWWGTERLAAAGEPLPGARQVEAFVSVARPGLPHIVGCCAGELEGHWPGAMDELFERHPAAMVDRAGDGNGFTLIHGDVNHNNVLVPRAGDRPLYLIDRQPFDWSLTAWLGAYDLAYAIALEWEVDLRRRLELPILRRYHDHLIRHGVCGYAWERLLLDYRLSVALCVYVAVEWCRGGVNEEYRSVWLPMLRKALTACDDLDCRALWQSRAAQRAGRSVTPRGQHQPP